MRKVVVSLALLLSTIGRTHAADPVRVGTTLPEIALGDQTGVAMTVGPSTRCILVTRDMDGGKIVKEALAADGDALLESAQAIYISDISRMPALVTRLFALPALKKRPYRVLLDRDGKATTLLPSEEGKVTVIVLDSGVVARMEFAVSADEVRTALAASPPAQ